MLTPEQLKELQDIKAKYTGLDVNDPEWDAKHSNWFDEWLDFVLRAAPEEVLESLSGGNTSPESIEWEEEVYPYLPPMDTLNKIVPDIDMSGIIDDDGDGGDDFDDFDTTKLHSHHDTNGDGDDDLHIIDSSDNGKADTAIITADDPEEDKSASKVAKEKLDIDEKTSTGKSKKELLERLYPTVKTEDVVSDNRQKNILSALVDMKF